MVKKLASGRSARWAFMDRFDAPNYDDPSKTYLTRWRVVQTPWFGLYVHRYTSPDPRRTLHDHPWSFLSIVLRGGYVERRLDHLTRTVRFHGVRHFNRMRREDFHSICRLHHTPTWTLLFVGRRRQTWGYLERSSGAWLWTEFDAHPHNEEFKRALAARKAL